MSVTVIRKADWLLAYDASKGDHTYMRDADLAFQDDKILYVGKQYEGPVDEEIQGSGKVLLPGLVNVHSHPYGEAMNKGFTDDVGNPKLGYSGLYEYLCVFRPDADGLLASAEVAFAELLKSGVTTLVDISGPYEGWIELAERSGLRVVLAPAYKSADWYTEDGKRVAYRWDKDGGQARFERALTVVDQALNHPSGRLSAMMMPAQIDTCQPELLKASKAAAKDRGIALQIHAAQSLVEFQEITQRHGLTPIQWLDELGFLGPETIISHCIFLDSHSMIHWGTDCDLDLLAEQGCGVAHCPTPFLRHGMLLEHFHRYLDAGVRLGIGTDTFPHNMLEELRSAALGARVADKAFRMVSAGDVFRAGTLGGASLLLREDIGRLAQGAKADFILLDGQHPSMRPLRDPVRSLVHAAAERAVESVYVAGRQVVADGEVLTLDLEGAAARLEASSKAAESKMPDLDWEGRSAEEMSPLAFTLSE